MKLSEKIDADIQSGLVSKNLQEYISRAKSLEKTNENLRLALDGSATLATPVDSNPRFDMHIISHDMGQ